MSLRSKFFFLTTSCTIALAGVLHVLVPWGEEASSGAAGTGLVIASAVLFGGVIFLWMDRSVVRPLVRLKKEVAIVGASLEPGKRLAAQGLDEIGSLAHHINQMLSTLESARQELVEDRETAVQATEAKSSFLSKMSHELRTPTAAIVGCVDLMQQEGLATGEAREFIDLIDQNCDHILELINEVLDFSRVESGALEFEMVPVLARDLLGEVHDMMRIKARAENRSLRWVFTGAVPQMLVTDSTRVKQVLINLIGNGLKFCETWIEVSVHHAAGDGGGNLTIDVRDDGPGMTSAQMKRIFKPFVQADASTAREYGGTGLGLTISKHILDGLGGDLRVASDGERGTTFTVELPTGETEGIPLVDISLSAVEATAKSS